MYIVYAPVGQILVLLAVRESGRCQVRERMRVVNMVRERAVSSSKRRLGCGTHGT
jgi:hypothetical protein